MVENKPLPVSNYSEQDQQQCSGHTPQREILFLFVHIMFHLLCYDHHCEEEQSVMRQAEEKIMARLGLERR